MRLKDGDFVLYQNPAVYKEKDGLNIPNIEMEMVEVKKSVFEGVRFLDKENNVKYNYRVRYIFRNGEKIENCCYDAMRIMEEDIE